MIDSMYIGMFFLDLYRERNDTVVWEEVRGKKIEREKRELKDCLYEMLLMMLDIVQ